MANKKKHLKLKDPKAKNITDLVEDIRGDFKSESDYIKNFIKLVKKQKDIRQIENDGKDKPFSNGDIFILMTKLLNLGYIKEYVNGNHYNRLMILDYDNPLGVWKELDIERYVVSAALSIHIGDINKTTKDISSRFLKSDLSMLNIPELKLPKEGIVLAPNCVINLKTLEIANNRNYFGEFDFINSMAFKILPIKECNKLMLEIVKRIHNDWTENNEDAVYYLKQLEFAALEGNGRGVYHVLKGDGGNGKSTFLNILQNLAGATYTQRLDLQNIMDDNSLSNINSLTKLVIGHDMSTNAKVTSAMLSRFKEFTLGEAFQINVKYKPNQLCQTNGLKVQNTNSDISFFENSYAIRRRIKVFEWTNKKLSAITNNVGFNLDALVGTSGKPDNEFYEALIAFMLDGMDYFKEFITLESSEAYTDEMLNKADPVMQFVVWMSEQGLLNFKTIPINILYQMYVLWMREENSGSSPLKRRGFTDRALKIIEDYNYHYKTNPITIKKINKINFNADLINEIYFNNKLDIKINERTRYLEYKDDIITDNNVSEFKKSILPKLHNEDDLEDIKELIIFNYLKSENDPDALIKSKY